MGEANGFGKVCNGEDWPGTDRLVLASKGYDRQGMARLMGKECN